MKRGFTFLLAEDDSNEVLLMRHAVEESAKANSIRVDFRAVGDGEDAIAYLSGHGAFGDRIAHPFPDLIVTI